MRKEQIKKVLKLCIVNGMARDRENPDPFKEEGTAPFSVALNNPDCIFDSASGFETLREALIWACNHGGRFNIQITDKDAEFYHYSFDGKHLQKEVGYDEWEEVKLK